MPGFAQATDLNAWKKLQTHHQDLGANIILKECFEKDPQRFEKFTRTFKNEADGNEILFDFSKNFLTDETLSLLVDLAKEANIEALRDDMFAGEKINFTEKRAVYHTALRNVSNWPMKVDGKSVVEEVNSVLDHMKEFSEQVRSGEWKGYSGKKINTIINVGIGGSDLYDDALKIISWVKLELTRYTVVPSWFAKHSSLSASATSPCTSSPTLTAPTLPKLSRTLTPRRPSSSLLPRPSPPLRQ